MNYNFQGYVPEFLTIDPNSENLDTISNQLYNFYVGPNDMITTQNLFDTFGLMYSDGVISHGVHRLVELTRKDMEVYFYRFDYLGQYSILVGPDGKPFGKYICLIQVEITFTITAVMHVDELLYLFNDNSVAPIFKKNDPEVAIMNQMTDYWSSFARDGKPSTAAANVVEWSPSSRSLSQTIYIDNITTLREGPYQERFQFWDELFPITGDASAKSFSALALVLLSFVISWNDSSYL